MFESLYENNFEYLYNRFFYNVFNSLVFKKGDLYIYKYWY